MKRKKKRKGERERERERGRERERKRKPPVYFPSGPLHFIGFTKTVLTHTNHCERDHKALQYFGGT